MGTKQYKEIIKKIEKNAKKWYNYIRIVNVYNINKNKRMRKEMIFMKKGERISNNKAITLIALVITIVILIILAAVAINLTIGENGLINRSKQAKELHEYAAAKEAIQLKLANLKLECEQEGKSLTKDEIIEKLEDPNETDIIIEGYIYELVAAVRPGVVKKTVDSQNRPIRVKDVVLSTKEENSFKFCVDDGGEITGVAKDVNPGNDGEFTKGAFSSVSDFEDELGSPANSEEEQIIGDSSTLAVGDTVMYRNTSFYVASIDDGIVQLMPNELKLHMYFRGNTNDTTAAAAKNRIWAEVDQIIDNAYEDAEHGITASHFYWSQNYLDSYKRYFNDNVTNIFWHTYFLKSDVNDTEGIATAIHYCYLNGDTVEKEEGYHIYFDGWGPQQNVNGTLDAYIPARVYMNKNCINLYASGWKCIY